MEKICSTWSWSQCMTQTAEGPSVFLNPSPLHIVLGVATLDSSSSFWLSNYEAVSPCEEFLKRVICHMRGQSHKISYVVSHNEAINSGWHSVPPCFLVINRWKIIAVVSRGAQLGQQLLTQLSFWVLLISHCLLHMLLEEIDFCSMKLSCRSFLCCKSCRTTYIKTRLIKVDMHLRASIFDEKWQNVTSTRNA
jgi:hypothetical protein